MRLTPRNKDEWIALILFPAKVLIVTLLMLSAYLEKAHLNRWLGKDTEIYGNLFMASILVLMFGGALQWFISPRYYAYRTLKQVALLLGTLFALAIFPPPTSWLLVFGWGCCYVSRTFPLSHLRCKECQAQLSEGQLHCSHCGFDRPPGN